jgi:peptidoglycan hydrolase-like protein with peptidoglycan-binding domain
MKKMTTAACALALGFAWAAAPAMAQTTPQAEQKAQKIEQKGEQNAWDKTKATTKDAAHKVKEAVTPDKEKAEMAVDVRGAQQALRSKGFDPGPVDGRMGPRTSAAVRDFQSKEGLSATGQLDSDTRARLTAASSSTTDSNVPAASPTSENNPKVKQHN